MSAVPEMVGMAVELASVLVMSTKNIPGHKVLVWFDSLRFRVSRTVIVVLIHIGVLRIGCYCIAS